MTSMEMNYDFKLKVDKIDSLSQADFNIAQVDWLLNEAQTLFVKQRYQLNNNYNSGFEATQKRIDDLSSLHIKFPLQPAVPLSNVGGIYELNLSQLAYKYMFLTRAYVEVMNVDNQCITTANVSLVQNDDLNEALKDPFNSPTFNEIPANYGRSSSGISSSIYLYPGDLLLGNAFVEYLKAPEKIYSGSYTYIDNTPVTPQDCELSEHTHSEIVDIAVELAASITQNPDFVSLKQLKLLKQE